MSWCCEGTNWAAPRKSRELRKRAVPSCWLIRPKEWEQAKFDEKWFRQSWSVLKNKLVGSFQTHFACHEDKKEPIRELENLGRVLFDGCKSRLGMKLVALKRSFARQKMSIVSLEVTHTYREIVKWLFTVTETVERTEDKVWPKSLNNDAGYDFVNGLWDTPVDFGTLLQKTQSV